MLVAKVLLLFDTTKSFCAFLFAVAICNRKYLIYTWDVVFILLPVITYIFAKEIPPYLPVV